MKTLILILVLLCGYITPLRSTEADIYALEALYNSTNGDDWDLANIGCTIREYPASYVSFGAYYSNFTGSAWNFTRDGNGYMNDPCNTSYSNTSHWIGLDCECTSVSCSVKKISLSCGNLVGRIPQELGILTSLIFLDFDTNSLTGSIPPNIGNLTQLHFLDLDVNSLEGSIPSSIGNLTQLSYLYLYNNRLNGPIPSSIGKIKNLRILVLGANSLTGPIPSILGNLANLTQLGLYENSLTGPIPLSIVNLTRLNVLGVESNSLTGSIPSNIGNLQELTSLFLYANSLTGPIPSSIGNLQQLVVLYLYENSLTGPIPFSIGNLMQLSNLGLGVNRLTGYIPDSLCQLSGLSVLVLKSNYMSGPVPLCIGNISSLVILNLNTNNFGGILPASVGNLGNLTALQVGANNFESDANSPGHFAFIDPSKQLKLNVIDMSNNAFSGAIDSRIFALPSINTLILNSNCFEGSLPDSICSAITLRTLVLSALSGGGCHKKHIWESTIFADTFNGYLSHNKMKGSVPQCMFSDMPKLQTLVLSGNGFQGQLPGNMSQSFTFLDISYNHLTGKLPAAIILPRIKFLDASYNHFNGTLEIFNKMDTSNDNMFSIKLEVNRLSGDVPDTLKDVRDINILSGNVFGCDLRKSSLPANDPNKLQYQCGSNDYDIYLSIFAAAVLSVILVAAWTYHFSWSIFSAEVGQWLTPFDSTSDKTLISEEFKRFPNLIRYGQEMGHLRKFVLIVGCAIVLTFTIIYDAFRAEYRTIEHAYGWVTTAAYIVGETPTIILVVFWILFMIFIRWMIVSEHDKRTRYRKNNNSHSDNNVDDSIDSDYSIIIPILRLLLILTITVIVTFSSNFGFLYVSFNYGELEQAVATISLGFFNFFWDLIALKWIFTTPLLNFGVKRSAHNTFITNFLGNEFFFVFAISSLSTFWVPLVTAAFIEDSCLYRLFIASPIVKATYEVPYSCETFYPDGKCITFQEVSSSLSIESPFLYNYTCTSTLIRTYVPVYIAQHILVLCGELLKVYYLMLYTRYQYKVDSDTGFCGVFLRLPKHLYIEHRLLLTFGQRESFYVQNSVTSKVFGKYNCFGRRRTLKLAQIFERSWTSSTFIFADCMSSLLLLLTFGVFAPLLAMSVMMSVFTRLCVNQLVLGRRLSIEAGILSTYRKRVKDAEEYIVSNAQGSGLRLKPDFASERLRSLQLGDTVLLELSIVEKTSSDSNLMFAKVIGEAGWVPLNAMKRFVKRGDTEYISRTNMRTSTIKDEQLEYSKLKRGDFKLCRVIHPQGCFVRAEPSLESSELHTLFTDDEIVIDLSQQENIENATFVKMHNAPGWVALEALEKLSTVPVEAVAAKLTDYPMNLPLWISGQTVESMEEMIRNADSPWGAACMLEGMEQECTTFPASITRVCLYTFLFAFATTAAFILNDTYNGITDAENSYWAPITIACVVPAMIVIPYVWMKVQEYRNNSDSVQKGVNNDEVELRSLALNIEKEERTDNPIFNTV